MQKALSFDDVLIVPKFSTISSRKDVDLRSLGLRLPIISANMDTITDVAMCKAMSAEGGAGCLHRFWDIDKNVDAFKAAEVKPWVSIGLGEKELERAEALYAAGAETFVIDVAHGASIEVCRQSMKLYELTNGTGHIVVGNFATKRSITDFFDNGGYANTFKVGIGGGSACTTRIKTGCGLPTLYSVMDCSNNGIKGQRGYRVIADGGIKTPGDVAKALAAGASAVMIGGMLAGTEETPGKVYEYMNKSGKFKQYRGSASQSSYESQGKTAEWRTAEGEAFTVEYKGPVKNVLQDIEGGLRSAFSYVGASNIKEFYQNAEFVEITSNGTKENGAHGKT